MLRQLWGIAGGAATARRRVVLAWTVAMLAAPAFGVASAQGAYSGANGLIAFEGSNASAPRTIYTVNPDGTGLTDVLQADSDDHEWYPGRGSGSFTPTWSPDGTRIAFDATAGLFNAAAAFCPDHQLGLWRVTPATGAIDSIVCWGTFVQPRGLPEQLSWSPDGSTLVLDELDQAMEDDLWLLDVDSGTYSLLYDDGTTFCTWVAPSSPAWSPLGDRIVFARQWQESCPTVSDHAGLFTIAPDGSGLTRLTVDDPEHPSVHPEWSPDGSKIVYLRADNYAWHTNRGAIHVVDLATGTSTLLTNVGANNRPVWSPDGTEIAFASNRDGDFDIYVMDADGSNVRQITNLPGAELNPSWQRVLAPPDPDGDDDGVDDAIDVGAGAFDDGSGTTGSIVDAAGLDVLVAQAEDAGDGVKVTVGPGTGKATLSVCGFTVKVSAGSEVVVTCGSVALEVVRGSAEVVLGGGTVVVAVPEGGSARVTDLGDTMFEVRNLGATGVIVAVEGVETPVPGGGSVSTSTDVTDPSITGTAAPAPDGQNGWNLGDVTVVFDCQDGESGIASCTPPVVLASEGAGQSVAGTAVDDAGNSSSTIVSGIKIDRTDPTVTCNPAAWRLNEPAGQVTATVSDGTSGPLTTTVSASVSTAAPGSFAVALTGYDQAGRSTTVNCAYSVSYVFHGFLAPVDNLPTTNRATAGQTIPVRWRITDYNGVGISDPGSFLSITSTTNGCSTSDSVDVVETYSGGSGLQYLGNGTWQFNWSAAKSYAGQCRTMRLNLADGVGNRLAGFQFK